MLKDKIVRRLYSNNKIFTHTFLKKNACAHAIKILKSRKRMFNCHRITLYL